MSHISTHIVYLTRHLTTRDSQPMIHRIDRDLRIRQTRPGIERPRSITTNAGRRYLPFFSLFLAIDSPSIANVEESAYVRGEKKSMNVQNEGKTNRETRHP